MLTLPQTFWKQNRSFKISLLFCILTGILSGWLIFTLIQDNRKVADDARNNAVQRAVDAAQEISLVLDTVPNLADLLAQEISSGLLADEDVESRLLSLLEANPKISAITACFSPQHLPDFVVARGDDRYCPFSYSDDKGDLFIQRIEDSYDYTQPSGSTDANGEIINSAWYHRPMNEGPVWGEPYLGSATGVYWGGYGTEFFTPPTDGEVADGSGRTPAGTIDVSLTLEQFQTLVGAVDFGEVGTGYGFIVSKTGDFIYHPESRFVNDTLNITDYDPLLSIATINDASQTEEGTKLSVFNHVDQ
ncbi:MAG: cache domain-containing protein, partial [Chloroflexi bacterium]|nr:cache domain-containing protein [Chloroflexota bacterium]